MDYRIISIGALAAHPLWGERGATRTGHSTTTLITTKSAKILVDPGMPATVLTARLRERANLAPEEITHVFLTSFNPDNRRGLRAFESAQWLIHEAEREAVGVPMAQTLMELANRPDAPGAEELRKTLEEDIGILRRCVAAPDEVAEHVDLFPLPGVTPGTCGLLLSGPRHTVVVCGDAVPTVEHLEQGQVLTGAADVDRARESYADAIEIADLLILGRDNISLNPTKRPF
ncbi:MAG: MBL fold metallo-hydrolase [Phycisphaerales bacterium]